MRQLRIERSKAARTFQGIERGDQGEHRGGLVGSAKDVTARIEVTIGNIDRVIGNVKS